MTRLEGMSFLERILDGLAAAPEAVLIREATGVTTGAQLSDLVARSRGWLRAEGVRPKDRVTLIAGNSARWIALDLAIMAEGALTVPLYTRQTEEEIAPILKDCTPRLVLREPLPDVASCAPIHDPPAPHAEIRIVYTSGTSGASKGVIFTVANVDFMLERTQQRFDSLLRGIAGPERLFHYLPFCFAGSWILLQSSLLRRAELTLCSDLKRIPEELAAADPHTFLNVPLLLERMRAGIEEKVAGRFLWKLPFLRRPLFGRAIKKRLCPSLRALICGSAPLREETQRFFMMLGIPVLQVYGLTETTAICTMDEPGRVLVGRVGSAIDGVEMRLDEAGEILVRGPHLSPGYWGKPLHEGWLATGDLGDVDAQGRWRIGGRGKDLLVLSSGHNVPPERIESRMAEAGFGETVILGDGRPYVVALLFGGSGGDLDAVNAGLPHYERVRAVHRHPRPLADEPGLLTANGKIRRKVVLERFAKEVEALYR